MSKKEGREVSMHRAMENAGECMGQFRDRRKKATLSLACPSQAPVLAFHRVTVAGL